MLYSPFTNNLVKMIWLSTLLPLLLAASVEAAVKLPPPPTSYQLPHTYIISFEDDTPAEVQEEHINYVKSLEAKYANVAVRHVFSLAFAGYSAVLNSEALEDIRQRDEVMRIDNVGLSAPNREDALPVLADPGSLRQHVNSIIRDTRDPILPQNLKTIPNRGWNAARISHRNYTTGYGAGPWVRDQNLGAGVIVYVLDTGVNLKNPGFQGTQTSFGKNFVGWRFGVGRSSDQDNHGHGTMCAGVISGTKHGLSPEAKMVAVKIANDQNRSACDDVVAGIEWVLQQPGDNNMKVISMSHYGFTGLPDVSTAVAKAVDKGLHFVVCAGNDGRDSCNVQPSNARGVISVASVNGLNKLPVKGTNDSGGREMENTNIGKCVTIFAPGTRVPTLSAKNIDPNYRYFSWGTSVAAPQVAALIANRLSQVGKQTPTEIKTWLQDTATKDQILGDLKGAPNLIAYNGLGA